MGADNGHLPPYSEVDEAGCLSCVLQSGDPQLLDRLRLEHFYDERHRALYSELQALKIEGRPPDVILVQNHLSTRGLWEKVGSLEYVNRMIDSSPSPANFPAYFEIVEDLAVRRAAIRDAGELLILARNTKLPIKTLRDASLRLSESYAHPPGSNGRLPEMVDLDTFMAVELPELEQVVEGVLHRGSKLSFGGGSKAFKTWQLLNLGVSVATGTPWLKFDVTRGKVLYVNFEIQKQPMQKRLRRMLEATQSVANPDFVIWNLRGKATHHRVILPKIRNAITGKDFSLVILDPIYKLYGEGTEENSTGDIAELMNSIEDLAVVTGAAVAFGAHFSKGNQAGKEAIDRVSGSGVFARDPDTLITLTPHSEKDAFTFEAILRNFAPVNPFVVRWEFPLMKPCEDLDPEDLRKPGGRPNTYSESNLLDAIQDSSLSTTDFLKTCKSEFGVSPASFYRLLKSLETEGKVLKSKINGKWMRVNK